MACSSCEYRGYVETEIRHSGRWRPVIKPCAVCDDVEAYSDRVQMAIIVERASTLLANAKRRSLRVIQGGLRNADRSESPTPRPRLELIVGGKDG